jgi:hypothetical protein
MVYCSSEEDVYEVGYLATVVAQCAIAGLFQPGQAATGDPSQSCTIAAGKNQTDDARANHASAEKNITRASAGSSGHGGVRML